MLNSDNMGLKFKKFKATFSRKTKETVPEVVCLRYHINSEFTDVLPPPTTSAISSNAPAQLGTNDVIKQKKAAPKPPIQNVFQSNTLTPSTEININKINNNNEVNSTSIKEQPKATSSELVRPKGILKKNITEISEIHPVSSTQEKYNNAKEADDDKKSALIFMTENHDDAGESAIHIQQDNKETSRILNNVTNISSGTELNSKSPKEDNEEVVELRKKDNQQKSNKHKGDLKKTEVSKERKTSTSSVDSQQADSKTVRWRETIIEIKLDRPESEIVTNEEPDRRESADIFKVHFAKHNFTTTSIQPEEVSDVESEPDNEHEPVTATRYGSRGAYSSQAASIFFAGEEPEPTPRLRTTSQQNDGEDKDINA